MHIDRRAFLATLGSAAVVEAMSSEARADALEHYMIAQLDKPVAASAQPLVVRRGAGALFGGPSPSGQRPELTALTAMPDPHGLHPVPRNAGHRQPHPAER